MNLHVQNTSLILCVENEMSTQAKTNQTATITPYLQKMCSLLPVNGLTPETQSTIMIKTTKELIEDIFNVGVL